MARVVLAMSGGVDSSVSAQMLVEQGHDVIGLFMRTGTHGSDDEDTAAARRKVRGCCSAIDAADAQRVADRLDVPFYALNFADDFNRIKDYFADEYANGRTPNPCVVCNTWLKFGRLWEYAQSVDADYIATGHYARIMHSDGGAELHRGADPEKDQSYFLFGLRADLLSKIMFPIGGMAKQQVRAIAAEHRLGVEHKPDSQEICFVPTGNYQDFLRQHRPEAVGAPGPIVDAVGKEVGAHAGISGFTIGQRKGLGKAFGEPRYVVALEPAANRVVIGPRELLARSEFEAERVNWLTPDPPREPVRCAVKIRYQHRAAAATIEPLDADRVRVVFDSPESAITPGQATVFFAGDRVLGGGWIA